MWYKKNNMQKQRANIWSLWYFLFLFDLLKKTFLWQIRIKYKQHYNKFNLHIILNYNNVVMYFVLCNYTLHFLDFVMYPLKLGYSDSEHFQFL